MASFHVEVPHRLDTSRCHDVLDQLITRAFQQYGDRFGQVEQRWTGDQLEFAGSAMGFTVGGDLVIHPDRVVVTGECPFFVRGKIESALRQRLVDSLQG